MSVMSVEDIKSVIHGNQDQEQLKRQSKHDDHLSDKEKSESNFWELINDVAKDLNLALQDLSPDLEITSSDITNGITNEHDHSGSQSGSQTSSKDTTSLPFPQNKSEKSDIKPKPKPNTNSNSNSNSNPILFKPTLIRIAGSDEKEKSVSQRRKCNRKCTSLSLENRQAQETLSLFDSPFSPFLLPQSKASYSSQLLSVMTVTANSGADKLLSSPSNSNTDATKKLDNNFSQRHSPVSCSSPDPKSSSILDGSCGGEGDADDAILSDVDGSAESIPASIGLLERLMRTHPIWFLPEISRAGVVHLLQGKEPGCFIVRQSSKPNTMALSVRLPEGKGPHVEHYLIEDAGNSKLRLEGSENEFSAVPMLICHYCQCCDELPVSLVLSKVLAEASRHQLTSLALLGQDYWQSTLSQMNEYNESNSCISNSTSNSMPPPNAHSLSTFIGVSQTNGQNTKIDLGTSKVSSPPPPVPPKQDATDLDPIIDTKKSSTVEVMMISQQQEITPKLPPRSMIPPPIPPRTSKILLKQQQLQQQKDQELKKLEEQKVTSPSSSPTCTTNGNLISSPVTVNSTQIPSLDELKDCEPIAPNTQVTLINLNHDEKESLKNGSNDGQDDAKAEKSPKRSKEERVLCYRSSLQEKASDYEDIWLMTNNSKLSLGTTLGNLRAKYSRHLAEQTTQTDDEDNINGNHNGFSSSRYIPSPFYTEPIDATERYGYSKNALHRHASDTDIKIQTTSCNEGVSNHNSSKNKNKNNSKNLPTLSFIAKYSLESLIDNLRYATLQRNSQTSSCVQHFNAKNFNLQDASIQVGDPIVFDDKSKSRSIREISWPVDSTWEWLNHNIDDLPWRKKSASKITTTATSSMNESVKDESEHDAKRISCVDSSKSDYSTTVEDLIILKDPQLTVPKVAETLSQSNLNSLAQLIDNNDDSAINNYDNLAIYNKPEESPSCDDQVQTRGQSNSFQTSQAAHNSHRSTNTTDTEFSEPWDSEYWDNIMKVLPNLAHLKLSPETDENITTFDSIASLLAKGDGEHHGTSIPASTIDLTEVSSLSTDDVKSSIGDRSSMTESKLEDDGKVGITVCNYVFTLASEGNNTFSKSIEHFIRCTTESSEVNPTVVMSNIRQFMNGMKNYLVKHGEGQFLEMVQQERSKLKSNEFLNIDTILEGALHKLVIKPLKNHLYQLFVNEYNTNGSLKLLSKNIKEAQSKSPTELGVRHEFQPPDSKAMIVVQKNFYKLQRAYSPLKKLEYLLAAISAIYNNVRQQQIENSKKEANGSHSKPEHASFGADDFLPIFIYVLVQCGMISAEIEADYCFGLLNPCILHGEGGYYLTALSSAVNVLKSMNQNESLSLKTTSTNDSDEYGFKKSQAITNDKTILSPSTCNPSSSSAFANSDKIIGSSSSSSITTVTSQSPSHMSVSNPNPSIISQQSSRLPSITDLQGYLKIMIPDELTCSIISKTLPVRPNMTTKEVCKMMAHKFKITNPEDYGLFKLINGVECQLNETDVPQMIKSELIANGVDCLFAYKRCEAKFIWPLNRLDSMTSNSN